LVTKNGETMNTQVMTQEDIRIAGIEILSQHMGITGLIRFLQQTETGYGDYTKNRGDFLGQPTLSSLFEEIKNSKCNEKT